MTAANGRAKPGPKPTLTTAVKAHVLESLHLGLSLAEALLAAGVTRASCNRARAADPQFDRGVKSAALAGKLHHLKRVHDGVPQWQSSAWFLERKYGTEFGNKLKVETRGRVVIKALAGASLEEL